MCQPAPGPRCASHARDAITAAQTRLAEVEQKIDAVREAYRATGAAEAQRGNRYQIQHDDPARQAAADAFHNMDALNDARNEARRAVLEAERDYKRTPTGQKEVEAEIAALQEQRQALVEEHQTALNDPTVSDGIRREQAQRIKSADLGIAQKQQDLANLRTERQAQVIALRQVTENAERLAAASPVEHARIAEAADRATAAQAALDQAKAEQDAAARALETFEPVYQAASTEYGVAIKTAKERAAKVNEATVPAQRELQRLYQEAGLPARNAGWYAKDSVDNKRPRARDPYAANGLSRMADPNEPVTGPLKVKIKRGPDQAKCEAAAAAAETDEAFQAANTRLKDASAAHRTAAIEAHAVYTNRLSPLMQEQAALGKRLTEAKEGVEKAERNLVTAKREHKVAIARASSGAGPDAQVMPIGQADVCRNPDGTVNAWVYRAPSEGHPNGRYLRATGVTTVHGFGAANALVLEDGTKVYSHKHYSPGSGSGAYSTGGNSFDVLVAPAQPGARPLREENLAAAGWGIETDSSG